MLRTGRQSAGNQTKRKLGVGSSETLRRAPYIILSLSSTSVNPDKIGWTPLKGTHLWLGMEPLSLKRVRK